MPYNSGESDTDPPIVHKAQKRQDEIIHRIDTLESVVHNGFAEIRKELKEAKELHETLKPISNIYKAVDTLGVLLLKTAALIAAIALLVALWRGGWIAVK